MEWAKERKRTLMEKYTYEEFVEDVRRFLLKELDLREKQIYFEAKDENGMTPNGDRLFIECRANASGKEVCGIHIEEMYANYQDGITVEKIGNLIKKEIEKIKVSGIMEKTKDLNNYQKMKKDLFIRLLNKKRHEKELKNAVYKEVGDIVGVLYLRLGRQDGCISSMKIRKDILKEWKLTEEEVWKNAVENTSLMTPPRIYRWEELLVTPLYSGDDFMNDEKLYFLDRENFAGLCLSTALRTNGAVAVFLPGVAQRLADLLNDSFYIVFTSIHEAMIHAAQNVYPEDLIKVMHDSIKEATSEQDFLTDKLYFYNRNEEKIAQYNPKTAIIDVHFPINPEE